MSPKGALKPTNSLDIIPHLEETVLKNQCYGVYTGYTYLYNINYSIFFLSLRLS